MNVQLSMNIVLAVIILFIGLKIANFIAKRFEKLLIKKEVDV